ncbi:hypothetical protein NM688_g176 [Phlebia brevispora]|uniref:Uncharacterized protein n=1 Tax=Phlebia brevispora TaxID=194682 RepID=A0ACC1TF26_9APHY|nr:hypothetical protein NM688_g176 [Phlebia brevispora]
MSDTTPESAIIAAYKSNLIATQCIYAGLTIVCYDILITIKHEYELVWQRPWSGATWLFLVNRCENISLNLFLAVLSLLPSIVIAAFAALRVFALLGHAYITAAFTFALGLITVCFELYKYSKYQPYYIDDPLQGWICFVDYPISSSIAFYLFGVLCTIAADIIAIMITWAKTYRHVQQASAIGINVGFSATLFRYGNLYFLILCIVNLVGGMLLLIPSFQPADPANVFIVILPNLILSHFLISLRQVNSADIGSTPTLSRFSVPNFRVPSIRTIIGNLGEPLADGGELLDDEDVNAGACEECACVGETSEGGGGVFGVQDVDNSPKAEIPRELV